MGGELPRNRGVRRSIHQNSDLGNRHPAGLLIGLGEIRRIGWKVQGVSRRDLLSGFGETSSKEGAVDECPLGHLPVLKGSMEPAIVIGDLAMAHHITAIAGQLNQAVGRCGRSLAAQGSRVHIVPTPEQIAAGVVVPREDQICRAIH